MSSSTPSIFVAVIDLSRTEQLKMDLLNRNFIFVTPAPPYTIFSAKKPGLSCTLYSSGKLVVQGKDLKEFIEFYLEPEILGTFQFSHPEAGLDLTSRIGVDESGKGDLFGPLCTVGVYANSGQIKELSKLGVCDSKNLSDIAVKKIAPKIEQACQHHLVQIFPKRYNELYEQFRNLNHLLAWCHATVVDTLVQKTGCKTVVIDQFAGEHVIIKAFRDKKLTEINLTQKHRAEEDVVVAAASILARHAFLTGLESLSNEFGIALPKGASALTMAKAREFANKCGKEQLPLVAKIHFKSLDDILNRSDNSDLPF